MTELNTLQLLSNVPIFSELSQSELRSITRLMTSTNIKEGRSLTKQGQVGREFIIILKGEASVVQNFRTVATLRPGDFFGERSVLTGEPRSATVTAETDMLVEVLTRRELLALLDDKPVVAKKMLIGVVRRYQGLLTSLQNITQSPVS